MTTAINQRNVASPLYYKNIIVLVPFEAKSPLFSSFVVKNANNPAITAFQYIGTSKEKGACPIHFFATNDGKTISVVGRMLKEKDENGRPKYMAYLNVYHYLHLLLRC